MWYVAEKGSKTWHALYANSQWFYIFKEGSWHISLCMCTCASWVCTPRPGQQQRRVQPYKCTCGTEEFLLQTGNCLDSSLLGPPEENTPSLTRKHIWAWMHHCTHTLNLLWRSTSVFLKRSSYYDNSRTWGCTDPRPANQWPFWTVEDRRRRSQLNPTLLHITHSG